MHIRLVKKSRALDILTNSQNFLKRLSYLLVLSCIFIYQKHAFALQPVQGWYAGVFIGPSAANSNDFDFGQTLSFATTNVTVSATSGSVTHSVLGGIGGQVGYRFFLRHRIEAEWYYNNNPIKSLKLNNYSFTNTYYPSFNVTNSTATFNNNQNTSDAYIQGSTNTGAIMVNFIYDLLTPNNDGYSKVVPFVGAGLGYSYVQNAMQIYRPTTVDPANDPYPNREILDVLQNRYIYAVQGLIGVSYFLDDFTWFGLDLRYFTTGSSIVQSRYTYTSPTATETVSSTNSLFSNKAQIISVNLSFSG